MGHLIKLSNDVTEAMEKGNNAERLKELYQGELTLSSFVMCSDCVLPRVCHHLGQSFHFINSAHFRQAIVIFSWIVCEIQASRVIYTCICKFKKVT